MAESFELPDDKDLFKLNLEDDVRAFLLKHLPWNRMPPAQREHLRIMGVDIKKMRRPSYIAICSTDEDAPPEVKQSKCNIGAEGVMAHTDESCVHLAFKCGNPNHRFHYSTFGIDTIMALAKACEVAWPGSISGMLVQHALKKRAQEGNGVLDPGEDEVNLDDDEEDEDDLETLDEDDDEEDDLYI
jgi:hypothetical protein